MWKLITDAVTRIVTQSQEGTPTDREPAIAAPAVFDRDALEQQFQKAVQLLQGGNEQAAQEAMRGVVAQAAAAQPNGPLYATARFKQATILSAADELAHAASACRAAVDVPVTDDAGKKERLEYVSYLGGILGSQSKYEEAETLLRDGAAQRKELYGPDHPQYAAGLAALADLLLANQRPTDALAAIDDALRIDARAKHERWPADLALRAYILKSANGLDAAAFGAWPDLTRGMQKTLVNQCIRQSKQAGPPLAQAVLTEVRQRVASFADSDPALIVSVDIALAAAAQLNEDHAVRITASESMVKLCQGMSAQNQLSLAWQALAMALDDAGRQADVPAAFDASVQSARDSNDLTLMATVLRNYALWADRTGKPEQAEPLYREAVDCGASSGDWSTHGRCTVAYGIFLHHAGRLEEARGLLEEAVAHLSPDHADFGAAQAHLDELI